MMNRLQAVSCFAALLPVAAALSACSSSRTVTNAAPPPAVSARVLQIQKSQLPRWVKAVGTVRAHEVAPLAAQVMGTITFVAVREGDSVHRGQLLISIDDAQAQAGLARAQAGVAAAQQELVSATSDQELAESTMKRYQILWDKKSVSPHEFDEIRARLRAASARRELAVAGETQARAVLAQTRTTAGFSRIRSPFDGVVTERRIDPGALAVPGIPLLTVESRGRYRLEATVDERNLAGIRLGQSAPVVIDAIGADALTGKVVQIVPAADPASRSFVVKIELPQSGRLRSGLFGRARFQLGQHEGVTVPRAAIVDRGQMRGVLVVGQDRVATLRYLTLGQTSGENVEVLSGLNPGEMVIAAPGQQELAGKRIEVQ